MEEAKVVEPVETKVEKEQKPPIPVLFFVVFNDDSIFNGGTTYQDPLWLDIPIKKKIKQLYYRLPYGDYLLLGGYDEYYHYTEVAHNVIGKNVGTSAVEYAYVIAKLKDNAVVYRISLANRDTIMIGDMTKRILKTDHEYIKTLNEEGWRGKE